METKNTDTLRRGIVFLIGLCVLWQSTVVFAQPAGNKAKQYFKGKTVVLMVTYRPGGGYDTYARMIAPFLERKLGATVVVQNVPGGGGLLGVNKLYTARANGLTIGMVNLIGAIMSQVGKMQGAAYQLEKFGWVGRVVAEPQLMLTRTDSSINTIADIKKMDRPFKYGTTGPGAVDYFGGLLLSRVYDFPINMVSGYASSGEYDLAMLKGEVDGVMGSFSSKIGYVKTKDAKPVVLLSKNREPELPDVPTILESKGLSDENIKLVKAAINLLEGGRAIAAPPNVPADRLKVLQDVWAETLADPQLLKTAQKASRPVSNLPGPEMAELVSELIHNMPAPLMALIHDSYYKIGN